MAAATGLALAGLGTALGGIQALGGAKRSKEAQRELNDYERQELNNAYEDMPISLEGVDYMRDQNASTTAGLVDAAQNAGSRGIIGAIPKITAASTALDGNVARYLDDQYNRRNYAIAGDNARIEGIRENRDNQNIAALSSQAQAGRQDMWSGIMGAASGLAYGARQIPQGQREEATAILPGSTPGINTMRTGPITASPYMPEGTPEQSAPYSNNYGGMFDYGDLVSKYPNSTPRF